MLLDELKKEYHYSELDAFLVLKDILRQLWKKEITRKERFFENETLEKNIYNHLQRTGFFPFWELSQEFGFHYAGGCSQSGHCHRLPDPYTSAALFIKPEKIHFWGGMHKRFLMISLSMTALGGTAFVSGILPAFAFPVFVFCCFIMGASGTFFNVPLMAL